LSDTIRIKRRVSGAAGPPATLANAELAFNENNNVLYYGKGNDGSDVATSIIAVGGSGAFAPISANGNVSNSGTPAAGQYARWVTATTIQGVASATVLSDIGAQPLDADLTALAALTGTNVIYYRAAANSWAAITIGSGLTFSGGTLAATGGGGSGNVSSSGTPTNGQIAQWTDATHIQGVNASSFGFELAANKGVANGYASLDATTKVPAAQLPSYVDDVVEYANLAAFPPTGAAGIIYVALNTNKIYRWSGTVYVEISPSPGSTDAVPEGSVNLYYTDARVAANPTVAGKADASSLAGYQPVDADLTALAALTGTNTIYYRSGVDTWSPVVVSTGLAFSGGNLTATVSGGTPGGSNTHVQFNNSGAFGGSANFIWNNGTNVLTVTGQISVALGNATSIVAGGVVEAASFKCTGTVAVLGPASSGNVALRPSGVASTTGQVVIASTGAVTVNGPINLPADPTTALQAATKQYVDAKAPLGAEYITSTADATLTNERVLTDTVTVTWDRTTAGQIKANAAGGGGFSSGTLLVFPQAAAPTGWTKSTTHHDKALRIVNTTGGSSAGTVAFSTLFARTATDALSLTAAQMPAHTHVGIAGNAPALIGYATYQFPAGAGFGMDVQGLQNTGSGSAHSHGLDMRVAYVDAIICSKD